ncbi:beta strand repeat-containing protein [Peristeroidobacter soli]|uniref:beta strand repeat-containing protein n=1 Tax=Peristeroidobacter soli TaxID=2497877 RepID=UPI001FEA58B8|nr:YDG domain-containing protein [Peristeroidobacter soli]
MTVTLAAVNRAVTTWNGLTTIDDRTRVQTSVTALSRDTGENVGTRNVLSATFAALTGDHAGNYQAPTLAGTPVLTITPRASTAVLPDQTKVYGNDDPALAAITPTLNYVNRSVGTWNGAVTVNDAAAVAVTVANIDRVAGEDVGTRTITNVTFNALTGSAAGNYLAPTLSGAPTLIITPAPLTATLADQTKVYGNTDPDLSSIPVTLQPVNRSVTTWDTVVAIDDRARVSATVGGLTREVGENVGTYRITAAVLNAPTGPAAGNYGGSAAVSNVALLTITPRPITISARSDTKVYDGNVSSTVVPLLTAGTLAFDDTLTGLVQTFDSRNAGSRTLNVTGYVLSDHNNGSNYAVTLLGASGTITPKALTASIVVNHKVYDGLLAATGTVGPLVGVIGADSVSLSAPTLLFSDKNVGIGKTVTASNLTLSGAQAGNYTFVTPTGLTANITPRTVSIVSAVAHDKVYDATVAATVSGGTLNNAVSGDDLSLVLGSAVFNNKNAGTHKPVTVTGSTLQGVDARNYTLVEPVGLTATITPAQLAIVGTTANGRVYDATTSVALNTSGSQLSGVLLSDAVSLVSTSATGRLADKNVGTAKAVTVSGFTIGGADAANYTLLQPTGLTVDITPRDLPVLGVVALDKVFDTTRNATLDNTHAVLSGILDSDHVQLSTAGAVGLFATPDVGNGKPVTASGYTISGADAGNYNLIQPQGLAAYISPFVLGTNGTSVSGTTAADKIYDGTRTATLNTSGSTLAGLLPGAENVQLVATAAVGLFDDKNVGTNKTVTITGFTLSGSDAHNYILSPTETTTASITPRAIDVRGVVANDKVYDATTSASLTTGGAFLDAVIGNDNVVLGGSAIGAFADKNVGNGKAVTVTGFTLSGSDAGNYTLNQPTGLAASITRAQLTMVGVTAQDKVYDATTTATLSGGTLTGVLLSDNVTAGPGAGNFADKNVGTGKAVTTTGFELGGVDARNYELIQPTGLTANITPASITVAGVIADDKVYDAGVTATLSGTATMSGVLGTDVVALSGTPSALFADKNVGNDIAVTVFGYSLAGADASNYVLTQPTGLAADITPATLTLAGLTAANKVYDTTTAATLSGGSLSGVLGSDSVQFTAGTGEFIDKNVGVDKVVTLSGYALTGTDAGNYVLEAPADLEASITPATLTLSGVAAQNKVYDATNAATISQGVLSGVLGNDDITLGTGTGSFADANVGIGKTVTVSGFGLSGADAGNYILVGLTTLTADITPAPLVVTATPDNREYDGTMLSAATPTIVGLQGDDNAAAGQVFDTRHAGASTLTPILLVLDDGNGGNNYSVSYVTASGTITPRAITVAAQADVKGYDGTTASNATPIITSGSLVSGDSATWWQAFENAEAGSDKSLRAGGTIVDGNDGGNYLITFVDYPNGAILTPPQTQFENAGLTSRIAVIRDSTFISVRAIGTDAMSRSSVEPESSDTPCAGSDDSGIRMPERPVEFLKKDDQRRDRSCSFF